MTEAFERPVSFTTANSTYTLDTVMDREGYVYQKEGVPLPDALASVFLTEGQSTMVRLALTKGVLPELVRLKRGDTEHVVPLSGFKSEVPDDEYGIQLGEEVAMPVSLTPEKGRILLTLQKDMEPAMSSPIIEVSPKSEPVAIAARRRLDAVV